MQVVDDLEYRMRESLRAKLRTSRHALQEAHATLLARDVRLKVAAGRRRAEAGATALTQSMRLQLTQLKSAHAQSNAHLVQLSPLKILDRGYAIADVDGKIVKSAADAPVGSRVRIRLAKDAIAAKVLKS